ncbi:MAG: hypothetical protein MRERV_15c026 [Mycoplasmataceae bacterium RV_VA103A]|nr:MAG: hypothetical protein MRERV_15c026 [Mycoplasmataceae bacterium RV_VA103A]
MKSKKQQPIILLIGGVIVLLLIIGSVFLIKQKNDKQSPSSTPSQTPPNNNQNPPSEDPENSAEKIKEELKNHLRTENYLNLPDCACSDDRLVILLRKEGKPVNKKEFSLAGMSEKVKQEIEKLSEQFPFRAEELINKDIAKLDQNPNLLYDGRVTSGRPGNPEQKYWEFANRENQEDISVYIPINHPTLVNFVIEKKKLYLASGIDKIKIEIISKNGLDFKCKFVELEDQITFSPYSA